MVLNNSLINSTKKKYRIAEVLERIANPVDVKEKEYYKQIGIRSHGKGIFLKEPISGKQLGNKRVFWVEPNCFIVNIVFAWEMAVARTTNEHLGYIASHRFPMYRTNEEVLDLEYLTNFFKTTKGKFLLEMASPGGAGRNKTLGQKEFERLELMLPSLAVQRKIGMFIKQINKRIEKQQEKIEKLEQFKKGMMQKIFSQELQFKDEDGGKFSEWENKKLGQFAEVIMGQSPKGENYSTDKQNTVLIQGNADMKNGKVVPRIYTSKITKVSMPGDIIMSVRAPVGEMALSDIESCIGRGVCAIRGNLFIYHYLSYYNLIKAWSNLSQGSTFKSVNGNDIKNLEIPIPSLKEKKKITDYLSKLERKVEREKEKLIVLEEQKKGIMQGMFA